MEKVNNKDPKPRKDCELGYVDPHALWELGRVAHFGTTKYPPYSYIAAESNWSVYYNAAQRHMMAFWAGYDEDGKSKLSHLVHAAWNLLALYTYQRLHIGTDDRPPVQRKAS